MVARAKKAGIEVIEMHQRLSARGNHLLTITAPAIALNAADQPLAVMVDFDQRAMAVGAVFYPKAPNASWGG